jgi:hypothetical protein
VGSDQVKCDIFKSLPNIRIWSKARDRADVLCLSKRPKREMD